MVDREQSRITTSKKALYFTLWNDRLSFCYLDVCQLLSILKTLNIPINDEYGSYTLGYAILEFL